MLLKLPYRFLRLLRNQWLPPDKLQQIQHRKLHRLLQHAYHHVPYYRRLFDAAGVKPHHIQNITDLAKLPVTRKPDMLPHSFEDLTSSRIEMADCVRLRTSGSQGIPFEVLFRREDKAWWGLLALRTWMAHGYHLGHSMLILSDSRFVPHGKRWFEYLGIFRKSYASLHEDTRRQLEVAIEVQPDVIRGMPSDVYLFAQAIRERGIGSITPKMVFTSAELLDPGTRKSINQAFGVELADSYGSIECGWIAWECSAHAGYHLNADCVIVEFIRDGQPVAPGEEGEVVVTNLHSYAMPFIRYSVGDVGIPLESSCPCGRGLPLMQAIEGRTVDCLTLADGRRISPYRLTCTIEQVPGVQRYQIVQPSHNHILVKVIPNAEFSSQTFPTIKLELSKCLGPTVTIETITVDELPKDSSGKFRVVQSAEPICK